MGDNFLSKSDEMTRPSAKKEAKRYVTVIIGAFIFSVSVNLFIAPLDLYNGGVLGIAQIIRTLLSKTVGASALGAVDIAGIINFLINVPLFILAFKTISKEFFAKTLVSVFCQAVFMAVIRVPAEPVVDDVLTNCIIGGILGGIGLGFTLRSSACGGGIDIIGVYMLRKGDGYSVGKVGLVINFIIYCVCAVLFNIQVAIYSIIYAAVYTLAVDRVHSQNINVTCLIISKEKEVREQIMSKLGRGVTCWIGFGAYTGAESELMVTVVNKYEEPVVRQIIKEIDVNAFVIFFEGTRVTGHFERRI